MLNLISNFITLKIVFLRREMINPCIGVLDLKIWFLYYKQHLNTRHTKFYALISICYQKVKDFENRLKLLCLLLILMEPCLCLTYYGILLMFVRPSETVRIGD